jgi:hypothetical protein
VVVTRTNPLFGGLSWRIALARSGGNDTRPDECSRRSGACGTRRGNGRPGDLAKGDRFIGTENARAGWMETRSELGEVNQSDYLNRQFVRQQTRARTGVVSAIELAKAKNEASVARNRGRPR